MPVEPARPDELARYEALVARWIERERAENPLFVAGERDPGMRRWYVRLRGTRRARHVFKWLDLGALWQSRNDFVARLHDPVNDMRRAWMRELAPADPSLVVDRRAPDGRCRVLVVGDPGEGDTSQWVLVPAILGLAADSDFMVVCSDVIYPTGDVNDYPEKFFRPYERYGKPIYALPGNHDWYDQLQGFMFTFCDRLPPAGGMPPGDLHGLLRLLWRKPKPVDADTREQRARFRGLPDPPQPAPYWVIDLGPLVLVGIDTGISGQLDRDQGDWLARVSREIDKPKVLVTGKPLIVDGQYHPGPIEQRGFTVDDVVRVSKTYLMESNRTVGEFIPTAKPERAEVPATPDLTPANIERRLVRATLPGGMTLR